MGAWAWGHALGGKVYWGISVFDIKYTLQVVMVSVLAQRLKRTRNDAAMWHVGWCDNATINVFRERAFCLAMFLSHRIGGIHSYLPINFEFD